MSGLDLGTSSDLTQVAYTANLKMFPAVTDYDGAAAARRRFDAIEIIDRHPDSDHGVAAGTRVG